MGCHSLLQRIFPTQGLNPGLLHCRQILYHLSYREVLKKTLLLLLLSHFSHVRLCSTPEMAAHQAPPSLGFSKQEHWSGLPFPSPMHESENPIYIKKSGYAPVGTEGSRTGYQSPNYMAPVLNIMVIPSPPRDHIKRYWINF